MSFYDHVDAAELSSRLTSDGQLLFASLDDLLNFLLRSATATVLGCVAMCRCSWRLSAACGPLLLALLWATRRYGAVRRGTTAEAQGHVAELGRVAEEAFEGVRAVRALGAEAKGPRA